MTKLTPRDDALSERDLVLDLLLRNSAYAFYFMQWVPYQTVARKCRLKLLHDVRTFDGREAFAVYPNGSHIGPFLDDEIEFIRISAKQLGFEYEDPKVSPEETPDPTYAYSLLAYYLKARHALEEIAKYPAREGSSADDPCDLASRALKDLEKPKP